MCACDVVPTPLPRGCRTFCFAVTSTIGAVHSLSCHHFFWDDYPSAQGHVVRLCDLLRLHHRPMDCPLRRLMHALPTSTTCDLHEPWSILCEGLAPAVRGNRVETISTTTRSDPPSM
ncbi:hypothetical protein LshimejAT787_0700680 [Lyophyllum shimeji]|uniref:Uncharacterized protein n=1 Tax=Lyophyllum shimeji TaxID=47721 RepID=A0A9P3PQ65_LYOSH|nr:hypothetical protein LshimejAT787_0700680 [Lyophyllum shimeji]